MSARGRATELEADPRRSAWPWSGRALGYGSRRCALASATPNPSVNSGDAWASVPNDRSTATQRNSVRACPSDACRARRRPGRGAGLGRIAVRHRPVLARRRRADDVMSATATAGAADFAGLVAVVTGGASGSGLPTGQLLGDRGARVAVLDLDPTGVPDPLLGVAADVTDEESVASAVAEVGAMVRATRRVGQQRRDRRPGHGRGQRPGPVAPRVRCQCARRGPGAADHVGQGVRVNCVNPGTVEPPG